MQFSASSLALLAGFILPGVEASSIWAKPQACIHITDLPAGETYTVKFKAGGPQDNCMNNRGQDAQVTVTSNGKYCTTVGYVESGCIIGESWWTLSYEMVGTGKSDEIRSRWYNKFDQPWVVISPSDHSDLNICDSAELCRNWATGWKDWYATGEPYFHFGPYSLKRNQVQNEHLVMIEQDGEEKGLEL